MKVRLIRLIPIVTALFSLLSGSVLAEDRVTLNFQYRGGALREDLVPFWIEDFERKNPDIKINWEEAPSDFRERTLIQFAAGVGPDVFEMYGSFSRDWAEKGMLLDLRPLIERDLTPEDINDFFPFIYQAGILTHGENKGYHYGLPAYANIGLVYYNQTLFNEAGLMDLNDLDDSGQWNWDALLEIGRKLTRRDGHVVTKWAIDSSRAIGRSHTWALAAGGKVFNWPEAPIDFAFDQEPAIQGMTFLQDLIWTHEIKPPRDMGLGGFDTGQVAMRIDGSSQIGRRFEAVGEAFEWNVASLPIGPVSRGATSAADMFGIAHNTKHPEEAWRFVKYLTSLDGVVPHMQIMGRGPAIVSAYSAYLDLYPNKQLIHHMNLALTAFPSPDAVMQHVSHVGPLINQALSESINTNNKPFAAAISEVADSIRALYGR